MQPQHKSPVEHLSDAEWADLSAHAQAVILQLLTEVRQLKAQVSRLEEQLRRNSRNSSQPPSQDQPAPTQASEEEKAPSTRRRGGQAGHAGRRRPLLPTSAVDEVVVHRPVQCARCGALLVGGDPAPVRHQVTELPPLKPTVTEHQAYAVTCLCCGAINRGQLPAEVAASQFGPNLVSLMALLMGCYRLSKRQVADLLANCFGIQLAASTVVNQQRVVSEALAPAVDELQPYVQQQPACNVDETSWRQAEQTKHSWLWVVVTTLVTVFHVAASRSGAVARQLLGEDYDGVVGTDRCSAYNWLDPSQRQVCWSHLLRDFQKN